MGVPFFSLYTPSGHLEMSLFARTAFDYWFYRGTWGATSQRIVSACNVAILFLAVFFFTYMFNWENALHCNEEACPKMGDLVHAPSRTFIRTSWKAQWCAFFLLVASLAAVVWECYKLVKTYCTMCEFEDNFSTSDILLPSRSPVHYVMRKLQSLSTTNGDYAEVPSAPGVDENRATRLRLEDVSWDQFLAMLCFKVQHNDFPGVLNADTYDELKFIQLLLIEENHRVALSFGAGPHGSVFESQKALAFLDDNIADLLVKQVLSSNYDLSGTVDEIYSRVSKNLFVALITSVVLWPFVSAFFFIKLVVKNFADLKSEPAALLQRDWSPNARWKLRLFNEVHHLHSGRLQQGLDLAGEMVAKSLPPSEFGRVLQRLGATVIVAITIVSFINAPILTYGQAWGKTLVWWLSMGALAYAIGSTGTPRLREYQHMTDLKKLYRLLHFQRESWSVSPSHFCRSITSDLLQLRVKLILVSFFKTLFLPLTLWVLYRNPEALIALIDSLRENRHTIDNIGDTCQTSAFVLPRSEKRSPLTRKLLKSVVQFAAVYTTWAERQCATAEIAALQATLRRGERSWEPSPLSVLYETYKDKNGRPYPSEQSLLNGMKDKHSMKTPLRVAKLGDWDSGSLGAKLNDLSPYRLAIYVHNVMNSVPSESGDALKESQFLVPSAKNGSGSNEPSTATVAVPMQSSIMHLSEMKSTAHEREQMFVSQLDDQFASVIDSRVRSRSPPPLPVEKRNEAVKNSDSPPSYQHQPQNEYISFAAPEETDEDIEMSERLECEKLFVNERK